jgi:orotate phosphoribosyltransferase
MDAKEELRQIIMDHSFLTRPEGYLLASGKRSPYYFDLKLTTLSNPRALYLASRILLDRISERVDMIGGLTSGADPLLIGVSQLALREGRVLPAFFVRDEQKTHGTERVIEGTVEDGMNVAIVDDVITTGGSVVKAIRPVEKRGAKVVQILILVDRQEGGIESLREHGYAAEPMFHLAELVV